jgi:hypothetical protein
MRAHLAWRIVFGLVLYTLFLTAGARYSYSYIPRQVYAHQVFPVTILAAGLERGRKITIFFDPKSEIRPIEKSPLVEKSGNDNRFYTFYFKAGTEDFTLPNLYIDDGERKGLIKGVYIPVARLGFSPDKRWCGVIASGFRIKTSQVSNFDEKNNLVYMVVEANEANLEDMSIPGIEEQGLEKLERRYAKVNAEYYFVIPAKINEVSFSYYDSIKEQLVPVKVSTRYRMSTTAAQESDLNPKDSSFTKLKKYTFSFLAIFFFLIFLLKRDIFYLILFLVTLYTLITFFMPHKKICVSEGTKLFILPIESSTVGSIIESRSELSVINRYGDYYKVEYRPGVIGWIKDKDVCKN